MTRLTHSDAGFIRSLQMSSARFFAFVEGRLDRPFFDRIMAQVCAPARIGYQVIAMKELPGGTGGKSALLATFRDLRTRGLLACVAFGKSMACVFIADKDSDDFTRKRLRSPHFIYSPTYDLEGHLFSCGDLHRALADACGITTQQAQTLVPDPVGWLRNAATLWKEWVALCLVSQLRGVNCGCTFDRPSQVNPNPLAQPDPAQVTAFKTQLASTLGIADTDLDGIFSTALRQVEASIHAGFPLKFFKGKWLGHMMQRHLEHQPRIAGATINGVGERLGVALVAQVAHHANCRCCGPYLQPLQAIAARL